MTEASQLLGGWGEEVRVSISPQQSKGDVEFWLERSLGGFTALDQSSEFALASASLFRNNESITTSIT